MREIFYLVGSAGLCLMVVDAPLKLALTPLLARLGSRESESAEALKAFGMMAVTTVIIASLTLGNLSTRLEDTGKGAATGTVLVALIANIVASISQQFRDPDNSPVYLAAIWRYYFRLLLGVVLLFAFVVFLEPEFTLRVGSHLARFIAWIYELPIIGVLAYCVSGLFVAYTAVATVSAIGAGIFGARVAGRRS